MSDETDTFRCHRLGNQMCIHVDIPVCLPAISLWLCRCVSVVRYKGSCSARLATSGSPSCNMAHVITRWAPACVNAEQYRLHVLLYISFSQTLCPPHTHTHTLLIPCASPGAVNWYYNNCVYGMGGGVASCFPTAITLTSSQGSEQLPNSLMEMDFWARFPRRQQSCTQIFTFIQSSVRQ